MKKIFIMSAVLLACTLLTACGVKADPEDVWMGIGPDADLAAITERTEYYDLVVESEQLFDLGLWEKNPEQYSVALLSPGSDTLHAPLGTQFVMGEPAQFWSEISSKGADIYLYRTDGSRELLLQRIPSGYASSDSKYQLFLDGEKNCYFYRTDYSNINNEYMYVTTIVQIAPSGEIQYENTLEPGLMLEDIRQAEDGRIYLTLLNYKNYGHVLAELDPETGQLISESRMELAYGEIYLGEADGSLAMAGYPVDGTGYRIATVDMTAQSTSPLLFFYGTSYGWHRNSSLQDFRVLEDGSIEFLWTDQNRLNCFRERMRMEKVEKTPLVLRGVFGVDETWLSEQVAKFNQENNNYHVVVEDCGYGNDVEDFPRLTGIQVVAGKGPDILCGHELLYDYLSGMIDKGALEVLNPYMEASGIREEDYFPLTFSSWRQGENIYGVTPKMKVSYEEIDIEILGNSKVPDIETLADALLSWEGNAVYRKRLDADEVLNLFLQGSESLWGMVDWETGSCDFNTPLFEKLLEVAKRYGYEVQRELESAITYNKDLTNFFGFNSLAEQEAKGRVSSGILFDDGCHGMSLPLYTMAINANSNHKEGAWEFISFLLGEEVQYREEWYLPPVHRESFDKWLEWEIYEGSAARFENGHMLHPVYYGENTSEEKKEEYKKVIKDVRPLPIRTAPILTIVLDEAMDYFNGSKSAEEISQIINNRVQLYLDEQK